VKPPNKWDPAKVSASGAALGALAGLYQLMTDPRGLSPNPGYWVSYLTGACIGGVILAAAVSAIRNRINRSK